MPRSLRPTTPAHHQPGAAFDPSMTVAQLELLLPSEAAQLLRVRESWLRKKAAARLIPSTRVGKHLRFSAHDIAAINAAGARPATGRKPARRATPNRRAISLMGTPSARRRRRISAQSSTFSTPQHQRGQLSKITRGSLFRERRHLHTPAAPYLRQLSVVGL
jgi:excisionase family DNA binding protein